MKPQPARRTSVSTKFSPPAITHAAIRPEVIEKLAVAGRLKLLIVSAPAGYGKTTLVAEAARLLAWPTVWYKLDALDHDPFVLVASLAEGISRQLPAFGEVLFERLENAHEIALPTEELLNIFLSELEEAVESDLHIVLDDYHEAADSQELNAAIDFILRRLPAPLHLCVLTRYEPLFATAKLRLADEMAEIGVDDLRLDADQIASTLAARGIRGVAASHLTRLTELTEGWPASIVLAGKALEWSDLSSIERALADPRLQKDVYSYLAEQVLQRESAETLAFLMSTCCLDHITVELANVVAAIDCAERLLTGLEEKHAFTFASADRSTYRYHNLFRDYLRHRCVLEAGTSSFRELQLRTAKALESAGQHDAAIELFLAANHPDAALAAVAHAGEQGIENSRSETIRTWLDRLPPQLAATHPWANFLRGQVLMRDGDFDEALEVFHAAEEAFTREGDQWGLYETLSAMECTLYWKGDRDQAVWCCRRALEAAPSDDRRLHTLLSLCAIARDGCDWPTFDRALEEASTLARFGPPTEVARLEAFRQASFLTRGSYRGASDGMAAHARFIDSHGTIGLKLSVLNIEAVNAFHLGRYAIARKLIAEGLEATRRTGYRFLVPVFNDLLGQLTAAVGDCAQGQRHIVEALRGYEECGDELLLILALGHEGTVLRRYGSLQAALSLYDRVSDGWERAAEPFPKLTSKSNRAFTRGLLGDTHAIADLERHALECRRFELMFIALKCELFIAVLDHRSSHTDAAISRLRRCVPQQLELGHMNFLSQELLFSPELALDLVRCEDRTDVLAGVLDAIALHWNSSGLLAKMLTVREDVALGALQAGARYRSAEEMTLLAARAKRHRSPNVRKLAAQIAARVTEPDTLALAPFPELTEREHQVLALIAAGHKNNEIASHLYLSAGTVKTHVNHIFSKLEVDDRVQAVLRYKERITV